MARNISTQDITWFLDLHSRGRLDLSPPYQRRSVWAPKERRFFLDTIFNNYPCPPIFLFKSLSDEGISTYHVVDGKQRLETIISFVDNKIALSQDISDQRLAGKKWKHLDIDQQKVLWNYQLAVEMLEVVHSATVKEIFDRYNRTSRNLERQELRHAKYDGWFVTRAEEEARKDEWRALGIATSAQARRMKDVQFISELMLVVLENRTRGFDQDHLDDCYAKYDSPEDDPLFVEEDFDTRFERTKQWILQLASANQDIIQYTKSYTHFYSLWSVAALHHEELIPVDDSARRFIDFMAKVNLFLVEGNQQSNQLVGRYALHSRGASTEHPQRLERTNIVLNLITNTISPEHEDSAVS